MFNVVRGVALGEREQILGGFMPELTVTCKGKDWKQIVLSYRNDEKSEWKALVTLGVHEASGLCALIQTQIDLAVGFRKHLPVRVLDLKTGREI